MQSIWQALQSITKQTNDQMSWGAVFVAFDRDGFNSVNFELNEEEVILG